MRNMVPVMAGKVREGLKLNRSQLAREAGMQPGVISWIETDRYILHESQLEKIAEVYRDHGCSGNTLSLLEEVC